MNRFDELELVSIQVSQPGKMQDKDSNMVFSVWKNGTYTIRTTSFATVDDKPTGYAYKLDAESFSKYEKLVQEYIHILESCPEDNHIPGIKSVDYTVTIAGKCLTGNFALFVEEMLNSDQFNAKEKKKMKWNNHIIELYKRIMELSKELESSGHLSFIGTDAKELHYLKPSTRFYISSFRSGIGFTYKEAKSKDSIIKRAIKEALSEEKVPTGKVFADLVSSLKENGREIARNSTSVKDFDIAHARLCTSLLSILGDTYNYVDVSRIVDYYFVLSLLVLDEIHTDEQALMLHYPVTSELLFKKYEGDGKVEYTFYQKDMRTPIPNAVIVPALSFLSAMRFDRINESFDEEKPAALA